MTETTSAATGISQAANQTPISGADIAGAASAAPAGSAGSEITSALIVDGTLWILIGFSVVTWALILIKGIQHLRISHHNRIYGKKFWEAKDFQAASVLEGNKGPAARVAEIGFITLVEADSGTTTHDLEHTGDRQELLDRRLRQQMQ